MWDNNNDLNSETNENDFNERFHQSLKANGFIFPDTAEDVERIRSITLNKPTLAALPSALDIINAGIVKIKPQVLSASAPGIYSTWTYFFKRLSQLGLKKEFVTNKFLPASMATHVGERSSIDMTVRELVIQAATYTESLLGLDSPTILTDQPLQLSSIPVYSARYKMPANIDQQKLTAYTIYVHRLAMVLLDVTKKLPVRPIPTSFEQFRSEITERFGSLSFETALRYTWELGIPVLPLTDTARFHGACWRVDGRNVIVLKQKTASSLRWLFDLIHEVRHAAQHPEQESFVLLENADDVSRQMALSSEEKDANIFAGQVILKGKAIQLANEAIDLAEAKTERLKTAVIQIANREGIEPGILANYLAFQLMAQHNISWWGPATNLQPQKSAPWQIAQSVLWEYVDIALLAEPDRILLINALR